MLGIQGQWLHKDNGYSRTMAAAFSSLLWTSMLHNLLVTMYIYLWAIIYECLQWWRVMMNVCMIECGGGGGRRAEYYHFRRYAHLIYLSTWSCEQLTYYLHKLTLWLLVWNFTLASYGMLGSQFVLRWMLSWSVEAIHYLLVVTSKVMMFLQVQHILEAV